MCKSLKKSDTYVTQHIETDQLSQKFKTGFLLFSKWMFFQRNFGAKFI